MVDLRLLEDLQIFVPAGKRSDFINEAVEEALLRFRRNKAGEGIMKIRKAAKLKLSTEEILKCRDYGRE